MDFQQTLGGLKASIDKELERQLNLMIVEASKESDLLATALSQTRKIALTGGKRIRGILLQMAYLGVGGKEKKKILKVAVAIEMLHLFFLVHDDIIDRGSLRHGQIALHKFFAKKVDRKKEVFEFEHFGNSVAIIVGDLLFAKANEIILQAGFGEKETLLALTYLQEIVKTTITGQAQDISIEKSKQTSQQGVLAMYENKTAKYTFEGPLQMGVIFAGVSDKKIKNIFSQYAKTVGRAYQLQDDLLGVFGQKEKIGKSTVSDIEEGKLSLMVVFAKDEASAADRKKLSEILGKKNLNSKEIQSFKNILIKTGAKKHAQQLAQKYLEIGKNEIKKAVLLSQTKIFLIGMVEYLEKREV